MIASKDKDIEEAAKTLFQFCTDEQVRKLCRDREEYYQDIRSYEHEIEKMSAAIAEKDAAIAERDTVIGQKDAALVEKDFIIEGLLKELETLKK